MGTVVVLLIAFISSSMHGTIAKGHAPKGLAAANPATPGVFDITDFGVKHKDTVTEDETNSENGLAFGNAWRAACHSKLGKTRVIVPKGKFEIGPTILNGPCNSSVTLDIRGTLTPTRDGSIYFESYWIMLESADRATVTGTGTIDGDGLPYDYCKGNPKCEGRPNIKIVNSANIVIDGVNSINPTFAHVLVSLSHNVTVRNMKMTAPPNSFRTDGVHVANSEQVIISNNTISTGTDCVNIVTGSKNITITELTCGPGNGISIGSYYTLDDIGTSLDKALNVEGVLVKQSKLIKTTNGLTIKTILGTQGNKVSGVTFEDVAMDHVMNPINILQEDQTNHGVSELDTAGTLPAKISDIHFRKIKGTSNTRNLVNVRCSPAMPCEGVEIADVDLVFDEKAAATAPTAPTTTCLNVKIVFNGKHDGINC